MKKLKKLAALLLVGVMALALLTACGGGGDTSAEEQAEARVMQEINNGRTTPLKNDDSVMISIAKKNLDADLKLGLGNYGFKNKIHVDRVDGQLTITVVAQYDYNNTGLQKLIDYITANNSTGDLNFNQASKWTRVGVVAQTKSGQTYIAVSVQVGKLA